MAITPITSIKPLSGAASVTRIDRADPSDAVDPASSFKEQVTKAIKQVNDLQHQADNAAVRLATGDLEDVHQAMIAMQKAKLALDFTIQVRNKVIESYQEIMRMQV
jgi:flagellar hook-basal body complex protein FliE